MVTQDMLAGSWNDVVGAVKEKYGQVTDDGLMRVKGNFDQFYEYARETVGRRPLESLAIVAGVSLFVGLVLGASHAARR